MLATMRAAAPRIASPCGSPAASVVSGPAVVATGAGATVAAAVVSRCFAAPVMTSDLSLP